MANDKNSILERNTRILSSWPTFWKGNTEALTKLYHPTKGTLVDHAFNVTRIGHSTVSQHCNLWLAANPDFEAEAIHVQSTIEGGWLQYRGKGTFKNDLAGIYPATGKEFVFEAVLRAWINEEGLIMRSEEWYTRTFGECVEVDKYDSRGDGQA